LWRISSPAQDAALVAEAERNTFFNARDLKAATGFPGQKDTIILRLKTAGLRARHAAVKELLTDEHKLYRFAFAESNVDRKWDESYSLMNLHLAQQMMGRFQFTDLRESLTTRSICLPANAVVVCLSIVGAGSPIKGLKFSIL
jgi:hypothetical protein